MTIPDYQELMLPLLQVLAEANTELSLKECTKRVSDVLRLSPEQRSALLPSGTQTYVHNRVSWASWHMAQAKLVEKIRRGFLRITDEGRKLLASKPARIDKKLLLTYPRFAEKMAKTSEAHEADASPGSDKTPTERIEEAHLNLNESLASDLRDIISKMDPYRFEQLVVDLLFAMGYGGSRAEAAQVTKKSGDEGIDGIISQDRLGLDVIYVQAKRWQNPVGREQIQNFVGALVGKHAAKGIFITSGEFNKNAFEYARGVQHRVILIDGQRLAELLIEHNVGVSTVRTIQIKRVDSDYFEES